MALSRGQRLPKDVAKDGLPITSSVPRSDKDAELQAIMDMSAGVPPEFGADVLMQIAESGKLISHKVKVKTLSEGFYLAQSAQQPISLEPLVGSNLDTRSGYLAIAFFLGLDRLSLQSRAVRDMLRTDPVQGLALFDNLQFPTLPPLGCKESLVYDPRAFYQALADVVHYRIDRADAVSGRILPWLSPYVRDLQSHSQVIPIAHLIASSDLPSLELSELSTVFANALEQLHGDERSFAAATLRTGHDGLVESVAALVDKLKSKGLPSQNLQRAFRAYLASNFEGKVCAEAVTTENSSGAVPAIFNEFNKYFRSAEIGQIAPLTKNDLDNNEVVPKMPVTALWQSANAKSLQSDLQLLRFGTGERLLTVAERETPKWNLRFRDFIVRLESWNGDDDAQADFFHEKSILYETLVELIPKPEEQSQVLTEFVKFLEQNYFQQTSRIEWFWHAYRLLGGIKAPNDRDEVLATFLNSRDPTLSLYARVQIWKDHNAKTSGGVRCNIRLFRKQFPNDSVERPYDSIQAVHIRRYWHAEGCSTPANDLWSAVRSIGGLPHPSRCSKGG